MAIRELLSETMRGRRRRVVVVAVIVLTACAALAGGELGGMAVRAGAVLVALAAAVALARRRAGAGDGPALLAVTARQPLGRDSGIAVVVAGHRRLLVGYGSGGVSLLSEVSCSPKVTP